MQELFSVTLALVGHAQSPAKLFGMPTHLDIAAMLRKQRKEAQASIYHLDAAIRVLEKLGRRRAGPRKRTISAAGRRRIAAAQRARWAKLRLVRK